MPDIYHEINAVTLIRLYVRNFRASLPSFVIDCYLFIKCLMQEIIAQNITKEKEEFNTTALHDVQTVRLFIFQIKSLNAS